MGEGFLRVEDDGAEKEGWIQVAPKIDQFKM